MVFCNSRLTAQKVYEDLRSRGLAAGLLVGERRVLERSLTTDDPIYHRFLPGSQRLEGEAPAFLVATSAGEVGLDLDADHMVCDLVTWERMVQRLGRVNRRSEPGYALVEVVPVRWDAKDGEAETRLTDSDRLLELRAPLELLPPLDAGSHDASPAAILALRSDPAAQAVLAAATSLEPLRPALTQARVEAWAMTSLEHHAGRPLVEPWIRGWVGDPPQTTVLWRRLLPPGGSNASKKIRATILNAYFEAAPPHLTEKLEAPSFRLVDILKQRVKAWDKHVPRPDDPFLIVLTMAGTVEPDLTLDAIRHDKADALVRRLAGRTLVIDARLGGLGDSGLLDGDAAGELPVWDAEVPPQPSGRGWTEALLDAIGRRAAITATDAALSAGWVREAGWPWGGGEDSDETSPQELRVERRRAAPAAGDSSRSKPQSLDEHLRSTVAHAHRIADAVLPPGPLRQVLVVAAEVHDLGKARTVWQNAMGAAYQGRPWAKTDGRRANSSLLQGYRHELGSLRDAEATIRSVIPDAALQDLALHLVASHHGYARPVILPHDPDDPPTLSEQRAREAALRYARLQLQWGPWGLAWFESLLRAADWAASRAAVEEGP